MSFPWLHLTSKDRELNFKCIDVLSMLIEMLNGMGLVY